MNSQRKGIVVCGTDTNVGKTIISSLLVQGLKGTYWKPIQSGEDEDGTDTSRICKILKLPKERWIQEVYKFQAAVSPHWAAEKENKCIDLKLLKIPSSKGPLIIETAGGLMVPLNRQSLQIDQLKNWGLPIILVSRSGLGTLNHTLLSIEALRKRDIPILGIFLNGPPHQDNPKTLEEYSGISVVAHIPHLETINSSSLQNEWDKQFLNKTFQDFIAK
tara:strand:+ start:130 stop:783 length:654 start_codon:yes stop_codon:yes gene_type:complete